MSNIKIELKRLTNLKYKCSKCGIEFEGRVCPNCSITKASFKTIKSRIGKNFR